MVDLCITEQVPGKVWDACSREFYCDPKAISPFNNQPGRCVPVNGGRRYIGATWPAAASEPIPPPDAP